MLVIDFDLGASDSVGGYRHKARRDQLLQILDVDLDWRMHQISDGERRRVQIVQGLMAPWTVLLLDEVTVDLDVMVRQALLDFLVKDTQTRNCTVLYATHIFDGLDSFPTHVCHLRMGSTLSPSPIRWPIEPDHPPHDDISPELMDQIFDHGRIGSKLWVLALHWLKKDRLIRSQLESDNNQPEFRRRGPRAPTSVPTDSETFYRKYDYTNNM